jgi:SAM-dependent methyltransferase
MTNTNMLPIPPFEMRQLVGPTDVSAFENFTCDPILGVEAARFDTVLDFGCGCGRLARQIMQQRTQPKHYVGFDLHRGMISWCQNNLTPKSKNFVFRHHNVENSSFNPGVGKPQLLPMPADDGEFSLIIALSVFTHTIESHAEYYLKEVARVLRKNDGELAASFFLFDKQYFPMMHDFQNALYISIDDPWNAVIFDRTWLEQTLNNLGLRIVRAQPPHVRGFQWLLHIRSNDCGEARISLPNDEGPFGRIPPPIPMTEPSLIGSKST